LRTVLPQYIRDRQTNRETNGRTTTMPIARPLLEYGLLKIADDSGNGRTEKTTSSSPSFAICSGAKSLSRAKRTGWWQKGPD